MVQEQGLSLFCSLPRCQHWGGKLAISGWSELDILFLPYDCNMYHINMNIYLPWNIQINSVLSNAVNFCALGEKHTFFDSYLKNKEGKSGNQERHGDVTDDFGQLTVCCSCMFRWWPDLLSAVSGLAAAVGGQESKLLSSVDPLVPDWRSTSQQ